MNLTAMNLTAETKRKGRCKAALLYWLERAEGQLQFTAGDKWFYILHIGGMEIYYSIDMKKPHSRRIFRLSNNLARAVGYKDLPDMVDKVKHFQYWRREITVTALARHIVKRKAYKYSKTREAEKDIFKQIKIKAKGIV